MEWKSLSKAGGDRPSPEDLKVCELCGTLNHHTNAECFTCGWRGQFSADAATVKLAWLRLEGQYEEVRLEHVTARSRPVIGDFGQKRVTGRLQKIHDRVQCWWRGFLAGRRARTALREQSAHKQHTAPRNDTGVA